MQNNTESKPQEFLQNTTQKQDKIQGTLIAIEGIDGSGKSTLARALHQALINKNINTLLTREPGGTQLGQALRAILQGHQAPINPQAEFLLFAADRAQHITEVIIPAIKLGTVIISDRMADSSLVYQGYGRGLDLETLKSINAWVLAGIKPAVTIYVKVHPEIAHARVTKRGLERSSFEKEAITFMEKIASGFNSLYVNRTDVIIVDGEQDPETVLIQALEKLDPWLKLLTYQNPL